MWIQETISMIYFSYVNTITNIDYGNINPSVTCKNASENGIC